VPIVAVIPIRSFESGKARLASTLLPEQRKQVGSGMAERTVAASEQAGFLPAIVTRDGEVEAWALSRGLQLLAEEGQGLNDAARTGAEWAIGLGLRWVVLHSDLPLVRVEDLQRLMDPIEAGIRTIAPSADGGTTALSAPLLPEFAYGPGSFHRHLAASSAVEVVTALGFLLDVDSPADLLAAMSNPEGAWLREIVGEAIRQ
jgi:2-phospho-L-lactate/phosphoenolpyruvate guanylyltransferase